MKTTKTLVYVEPVYDWVQTDGVKEVFRHGMGMDTLHFYSVIEAFRALLKVDVDEGTLLEVVSRLCEYRDGSEAPGYLLDSLASFIDPKKIEHTCFFTDNMTAGDLSGFHMLEAIAIASRRLDTELQPPVCALMSWDIDTLVWDNPLRKARWENNGIGAVQKDQYPIAMIWAGYRLGQDPNMGFGDFFKEIANFPYEDRFSRPNALILVRDSLVNFTIAAQEGLTAEHAGLLLRLPIEEIEGLAYVGRLSAEQTTEIIAELSKKYPREDLPQDPEVRM